MQRVGLRDVTNQQPENAGVLLNKNGESVNKRRRLSHEMRANQNVAMEDVDDGTFDSKTDYSKMDPQLVPEYSEIVYAFLKKREQDKDIRIMPNFLDSMDEVNSRMRQILLDWLVEVHYKFKLLPETLYLCVNLIDRYLQKDKTVAKKRLQLLGGTCMLIAAKNEEYKPPEVKDICYIMDSAYTADEVLNMECQILNKLKFGVTYASPLQFLDIYMMRNGIEHWHWNKPGSEFSYIAYFCLEAALLDHKLCCRLPSELAMAAVYLASRIENSGRYIDYQGYLHAHVKDLATDMWNSVCEVLHKERALGKKYSKEKFGGITTKVQEARRNCDEKARGGDATA